MNGKELSMRLIWLSHTFNENTPAYGGNGSFVIKPEKALSQGDSCNTVNLSFSNHLGSHVDAPQHFISDGKTVDNYLAEEWVFSSPLLLDIKAAPGQIIKAKDIEIKSKNGQTDLLLIRTQFEQHRESEIYWKNNPGISPELADYLINVFPSLRAIGLDSISLSSFQHRQAGRLAHKAFLSKGLRIFEDLALAKISGSKSLTQVIALPLRFIDADGAPCSVVGWENL